MMLKSRKNYAKLTPKLRQNDAKMMPKRRQNDAKTMPKRCQNDAKTIPKRCQNDAKTPPKRRQTATKTPPKRHQNATKRHQTLTFSLFFVEKHTIRARGESNRLPPGSDPPTSRVPNHYANPAPEPRLLSGFLCTANTGPGRAVRVNCFRPEKHDLGDTGSLISVRLTALLENRKVFVGF